MGKTARTKTLMKTQCWKPSPIYTNSKFNEDVDILEPDSLMPEQHQNYTKTKHQLIILAPKTSHIHSHLLTVRPPLRVDLAVPPPPPHRSVLACVQNKLSLSIGNCGGPRPCCFAGAEGAAGCQWSAHDGASGNSVTLTPSSTPAWVRRGGRKTKLLQPSSWSHCHGWAHSGLRPKERQARPLTCALSSWGHS